MLVLSSIFVILNVIFMVWTVGYLKRLSREILLMGLSTKDALQDLSMRIDRIEHPLLVVNTENPTNRTNSMRAAFDTMYGIPPEGANAVPNAVPKDDESFIRLFGTTTRFEQLESVDFEDPEDA